MTFLSNIALVQLLLFISVANIGKVGAMESHMISDRRISSSRIKRFIFMERLPSSSTGMTHSTTAALSLPPGIISPDRVHPTVEESLAARSPTAASTSAASGPTVASTQARPATARTATTRATTARAATARATTARAATARATTARAATARATTARAATARATTARAATARATTARAATARATTARAATASLRASAASPRAVTTVGVTGPTSPPNALGCSGNFTSSSIPTSVHTLKVGDINVVAAMGDSITAGNGARASNVFGVLTEDRGRVFSIGGDQSYAHGVTTLPNLLKVFNPDIYGFSTGSGDYLSQGSNLNVARAGAVARDMPRQAVTLIARMMADPNVNYTSDWKVVTLLVGGNDLCESCLDHTIHTAAVYKDGLERALDIMHARMPRTLVNLVQVFDINIVAHLASANFLCAFVIGSICPCGVGTNVNRPALRSLALQYRQGIEDLVATGKYDTRPDFSVVIQPFFSRLSLPRTTAGRTDFSFFAPDCFHLSDKGQRAAGKALFNNLVQPSRSKQTDLLPMATTSCPTTAFIPTRLN